MKDHFYILKNIKSSKKLVRFRYSALTLHVWNSLPMGIYSP